MIEFIYNQIGQFYFMMYVKEVNSFILPVHEVLFIFFI